MCPACLASIAQIAAGGTTAVGLTALVVMKLRTRIGAKSFNPTTGNKGDPYGKNRVTR